MWLLRGVLRLMRIRQVWCEDKTPKMVMYRALGGGDFWASGRFQNVNFPLLSRSPAFESSTDDHAKKGSGSLQSRDGGLSETESCAHAYMPGLKICFF